MQPRESAAMEGPQQCIAKRAARCRKAQLSDINDEALKIWPDTGRLYPPAWLALLRQLGVKAKGK
jgi:hypothetical protein